MTANSADEPMKAQRLPLSRRSALKTTPRKKISSAIGRQDHDRQDDQQRVQHGDRALGGLRLGLDPEELEHVDDDGRDPVDPNHATTPQPTPEVIAAVALRPGSDGSPASLRDGTPGTS